MAEPAISTEEMEALASVTLRTDAYGVQTLKTEDDIDIVVLTFELTDENGESFYIRPFFTKQDAEAFATAIQEKISGSPQDSN